MKRSFQPKRSSSVGWVSAICSQISRGNYKKALRSFEVWAEKRMDSPAGKEEYEIARGVYMILTLADSSLQEDFGVQWLKRKQPSKSTQERCGFCLKPRLEVDKLIAGAQAYICDACVRECFQVISELKQSSRGTEPKVARKKRKQ